MSTAPTGSRRAVFFDKDGIINPMIDRGENFVLAGKAKRFTAPWTLEELTIFPEMTPLIEAVHGLGYLAIVITNQPDVRYGVMEEPALDAILERVRGLGFDDVFACRHGRDDGCQCKKPKPGLLHAAAGKWDIDLLRSYMLGDMQMDVDAARAAGCTPILLDWHYNSDVVSCIRIMCRHDVLRFL